MEIYPFLPNPLGFRCKYICLDQDSVILELVSVASTAVCPACEQSSHRIHSRYYRTLSDLPWMGMAVRLRLDYKAVEAALSLEWSNGQVEGQINRLKLIKRQMYGRASFELLRQRVLNTG